MATLESRVTITKAMLDDTLREIRLNELSDREIAEKCLGDPSHKKTVSDIRTSHGYKKDRSSGKLVQSQPRMKRTWEKSSMQHPAR